MHRFLSRCRSFALLASCSCLLLACDPDSHLQYLPVQVQSMEFPDTLVAGTPDTLRLGAYVGIDRCELMSLRLRRQGDSLIVEGSARCRITEGIESPPSVNNGQWLELEIPALTPGRYFLLGNDLLDTLEVVASSASLPQRRIAAHGSLAPRSGLACGTDAWSFYPELAGWAPGLWRAYLLHARLPLPEPWPDDWQLHATVLGPPTCERSYFTAELRLRSFSVH